MFWFKGSAKTHLGVDIGAAAIKLVELEKKEGRYKLKNYAIFSIGDYFKRKTGSLTMGSMEVTNQQMAEMLKETISVANIKCKRTHLSIPVYSSFSTLIDFPDISEEEIAAAIPYEARKYIPVPVSEVILDWSVVGRPSEMASDKTRTIEQFKKPGELTEEEKKKQKDMQPGGAVVSSKRRDRLQVLIVAVPKEIVRDKTQVGDLAGLKLKGVELETFSLTRALVGNDKSPVLLVDAGARSVNVSIVDEGLLKITHNLEMGGLKILESISKKMFVRPSQAEQLKNDLLAGRLTEEQKNELSEVIKSNLWPIVVEINKIIDDYQDLYGKKVEKCILSGGVIKEFGFLDYFMDKLDLEVLVGDPFARVSYPDKLKPIIKEIGPSLAVAVGLAMRG